MSIKTLIIEGYRSIQKMRLHMEPELMGPLAELITLAPLKLRKSGPQPTQMSLLE